MLSSGSSADGRVLIRFLSKQSLTYGACGGGVNIGFARAIREELETIPLFGGVVDRRRRGLIMRDISEIVVIACVVRLQALPSATGTTALDRRQRRRSRLAGRAFFIFGGNV